MSAVHQRYIAEYHQEILNQHGCDMYRWHGNWHATNAPPDQPGSMNSPRWGADADFGFKFLQMHHEMVQAADGEPRFFMEHRSLRSWYAAKGYAEPPRWQPGNPFPEELAYMPDENVFPQRVRDCIEHKRQLYGEYGSITEMLARWPADYRYGLPSYFTVDGARRDECSDCYTGARKLSDYLNVNQLGCAIAYPHGNWHINIGGAMRDMLTAIADPIFYWGVHLIIDEVYLQFLAIDAARREQGVTDEQILAGRAPDPCPISHCGARTERELLAVNRLRADRECPDLMTGFQPCHGPHHPGDTVLPKHAHKFC